MICFATGSNRFDGMMFPVKGVRVFVAGVVTSEGRRWERRAPRNLLASWCSCRKRVHIRAGLSKNQILPCEKEECLVLDDGPAN